MSLKTDKFNYSDLGFIEIRKELFGCNLPNSFFDKECYSVWDGNAVVMIFGFYPLANKDVYLWAYISMSAKPFWRSLVKRFKKMLDSINDNFYIEVDKKFKEAIRTAEFLGFKQVAVGIDMIGFRRGKIWHQHSQ